MNFVENVNDKDLLYRHFVKDPATFAYHIGDLDNFFYKDCRWPSILDRDGNIIDTILIFTGLATPTVMIFALTRNLKNHLEQFVRIFPERFFCHFDKDFRELLRQKYNEQSLGTHLKMEYFPKGELTYDPSDEKIIRLDKSNLKQLEQLYVLSYPDNYFHERMLETSKYFGYLRDGNIIGVSGVHVYSKEYKTAVLGNIATAKEFRGKGIASLLTGKLVKELRSEGMTISLNVKADNFEAIRCYKKLGFKVSREYEEALFISK
jgi:ribosomal protein S18 acetylase RimI-like enzyme